MKHLWSVFGTPSGDSGAPNIVLGAFWVRLGCLWRRLGAIRHQKCPTPYVLPLFFAFSCFVHFCAKICRFEGAWGRSGGSGKPLGGFLGAPRGVSGAPKGVLGASWGRLGASWGRLGGLLGPPLGHKKRLRGLLKVLKTMCFTMVFGVFVFCAVVQ